MSAITRVSRPPDGLPDTPLLLTVFLLKPDDTLFGQLQRYLRNSESIGEIKRCHCVSEIEEAEQVQHPVVICNAEELRVLPPGIVNLIVLGHSNEHALDAFASNAAGFIQRPLSENQVFCCLDRIYAAAQQKKVRERYAQGSSDMVSQAGISREALTARLNRLLKKPRHTRRLALRSASAWTWLEYGDVLWIESAGDYLVVHCYGEHHVVRCSLCDMSRKLDDQFIRISRSAIVNVGAVKGAEQRVKGMLFLLLINDVKLKVSRQYAMRSRWLNKWL